MVTQTNVSSAQDSTTRGLPRRVVRSVRYRAGNLAWRMFEKAKKRSHMGSSRATDRHVLIVGCQRSGTTHLERLFRADPRSCVFSEFSPLSIAPDKTVWQPLDDVIRQLKGAGGGYSVARSLYASHRSQEILDALAGSVGVWVYREAGPVVRSMMQKWGSGFRAISQKVESLPDGAWELDGFWDDVESFASKHSDLPPDQRIADIYGAFWYLRNRSFFDLGLNRDPRITLMSYEALTRDPREALGGVWRELGVDKPNLTFPLQTRRPVAQNSRPSPLSDTMQRMCDDLYQQLRSAEDGQ